MSSSIQNTKILAVDTSPAMLEVLKNFAARHGYDSDRHSDPADAVECLKRCVEQSGQDFRCVLLGWPQGDTAIISDLLRLLSTPDYQDLPLVIICQEITSEISALTRRRAGTNALLWKEYQQASDLIDQLPVVPAHISSPDYDSAKVDAVTVKPDPKQSDDLIRALLIDQTPSICHTLKELMVSNGYEVTVADSALVATELVGECKFDLIVTDYHIHEVNGHNTLGAFRETVADCCEYAVMAVISAKYTDQVIRNSLASGAVACLFKNESSELLFARVHALATARSAVSSVRAVENSTGVEEFIESGDKSADLREADQTDELSESSNIGDSVAEPELDVQPAGAVSREEFYKELGETLELVSDGHHGVRYNLLMLDVQIEASTGDRLSLGDSTPMCRIVEGALGRLYKRPLSLTYLGNGQFAMLLVNHRLQDALMLTRKVLQVVPKMVRYLNDLTLVSHAAVVQIDGTAQNVDELIHQCRAAAARTRKDQRDNCALVLSLKKYLTGIESKATRAESVSAERVALT